jgi:hypothetical protein
VKVAVVGDRVFTTISGGYGRSCALEETGAAWCWGNANTKGEQGTGDNTGHSAPVRLQDGNISWSTLRARSKTIAASPAAPVPTA